MKREKELDLRVLTFSNLQKLQFKHKFKIHTTFDKAKFVDEELLRQIKRQFKTNFTLHDQHNNRIREAVCHVPGQTTNLRRAERVKSA